MELNDSRTVSVVMCTYNGAKYLREQLDSIVRQTYPVLELIIQDDGSTDGTKDILDEYEANYPYISVYYNNPPKGINGNFMSCIRRAKGDYVAISDQDDIWERDKLAVQMEQIGDRMLSSGFSKPFAAEAEGGVKIYFDDRKPNLTAERFIYINSLPGHTQLIRKDFLSKIPNVDCWLQCFLYDQMFSVVAACYDSISFCDKVLVNQRRHLSAATYTKPLNYGVSVRNMFLSVKRTWSLYRELRPKMRQYFKQVYELLSSLPEEAAYGREAQKMAYYQSQDSFAAYIRLTCLCVKCRHRIFYSDERFKGSRILRALYFPISCSDYFRYLSEKQY